MFSPNSEQNAVSQKESSFLPRISRNLLPNPKGLHCGLPVATKCSKQHSYQPLPLRTPWDLLDRMAQWAEQLTWWSEPAGEPSLWVARKPAASRLLSKWAGVTNPNEEYIAPQLQRPTKCCAFYWLLRTTCNTLSFTLERISQDAPRSSRNFTEVKSSDFFCCCWIYFRPTDMQVSYQWV